MSTITQHQQDHTITAPVGPSGGPALPSESSEDPAPSGVDLEADRIDIR